MNDWNEWKNIIALKKTRGVLRKILKEENILEYNEDLKNIYYLV